MRIITANMGNKAHNVTHVQQRAQLGRLAPLADVLVLQEARYPLIPLPRGFRATPHLAGTRQVRLIVRKTLPIAAHGYLRIHPGLEHAWPVRELPYVTLTAGPDGKRRPTTILGVHLNSAIEAGGKWAATGMRNVYTRQQLDSLVSMCQLFDRLGHRTIAVGDYNVDAYADQRVRDRLMPYERFAGRAQGIGFHEALPAVRSGTHGSRRIDRAFHTTDLAVTVRDLARRDPFDHQPVLFTTSAR